MKPKFLFVLLIFTLGVSLFYLGSTKKGTQFYTYEASYIPQEVIDPILEKGGKDIFFRTYKINKDFSNFNFIIRLSKEHKVFKRKIRMYIKYGDNFKRISIFPISLLLF